MKRFVVFWISLLCSVPSLAQESRPGTYVHLAPVSPQQAQVQQERSPQIDRWILQTLTEMEREKKEVPSYPQAVPPMPTVRTDVFHHVQHNVVHYEPEASIQYVYGIRTARGDEFLYNSTFNRKDPVDPDVALREKRDFFWTEYRKQIGTVQSMNAEGHAWEPRRVLVPVVQTVPVCQPYCQTMPARCGRYCQPNNCACNGGGPCRCGH